MHPLISPDNLSKFLPAKSNSARDWGDRAGKASPIFFKNAHDNLRLLTRPAQGVSRT